MKRLQQSLKPQRGEDAFVRENQRSSHWEMGVGGWEVGGSGASDETKGGRGNQLGFGEGPETRVRC